MITKRFGIIASLLLGTAAITGFAFAAASVKDGAGQPPFALSQAAPTPEALVRNLLAALEKNDEKALHALRVDEREYRELIAPGTVPPGQPPRQTDAKVSEMYWRILDSKSRDLGRELLKRFGGKSLTYESFEFTKSEQDYAWYRAKGEVRVHVKNAAGAEAVVPAGWVAEVDGRYKFIGLNWNE